MFDPVENAFPGGRGVWFQRGGNGTKGGIGFKGGELVPKGKGQEEEGRRVMHKETQHARKGGKKCVRRGEGGAGLKKCEGWGGSGGGEGRDALTFWKWNA